MKWLGIVISVLFCVQAFAGPSQTITMKDGSRVSGEVVSLNNGIYQIKTPSIGVLSIRQSEVLSIQAAGASAAPAPSLNMAEVKKLQDSLLNDPGVMQMIQTLQNDPQFKSAMSDPAVMKAIQSGDMNALSQNPKIKALMNHSAVKRLSGRGVGQ